MFRSRARRIVLTFSKSRPATTPLETLESRPLLHKHTLLNIYNSLIVLYIPYSLTVWRQTSKTNWDAILVLQKRALRFIHFSDRKEHAILLFVENNILLINIMYFEKVLTLIHDVSSKTAPIHIVNLFQNTSSVHSYSTRSSTSGNFYINKSNLEIQRKSFSRIGPKWWNEIPLSIITLPK